MDALCLRMSGHMANHTGGDHTQLWSVELDGVAVQCEPAVCITTRLADSEDRVHSAHAFELARTVAARHPGAAFATFVGHSFFVHDWQLFGKNMERAAAETLAIARSQAAIESSTVVIPITPEMLALRDAEASWMATGIPFDRSQWDDCTRQAWNFILFGPEFEEMDLRAGDLVVHTRLNRGPDEHDEQNGLSVHANLLLRPVRGWERVRRRMRLFAFVAYWLRLTEKLMAPGGSARQRDLEEYEAFQAEMESEIALR